MFHRIAMCGAAAAFIALASCSSDTEGDKCPAVSVLVDTATYAMAQGNPAKLVYTAEITDAKGDCDVRKYDQHVNASVDISFHATRASADAAATYTVPYFAAITTEGRVLAKGQYSVQVAFEPGQATATAAASLSSLSLTVGLDKKPTDYGILVGFQLTKAQLDYNRRVGRFAP
jgi:hypothetical protein